MAEWGIDKTETGDTSPSLKTEFVHEGDKSRLCARRRLLKDEGGLALSTLILERCAGAALPGRALEDASSLRRDHRPT
jgi:hypothetical protein